MAFATEHFRSGEGDRCTLGNISATKLFNVYTDNEWDDPTLVLAAGRTYCRDGTVPINVQLRSRHPNQNFNQTMVIGYDRGVRFGATYHQSVVLYDLPADLSDGRWHIDFELGETTERILFDEPLPSNFDIGDPTQYAGDAPPSIPRPFGTAQYAEVKEGGTYSTAEVSGATPVPLTRIAGWREEPYERFGSAFRFSVRRIVDSLTWDTVHQISNNFERTVNRNKFLVFDPGTVRFVGMSGREIPAQFGSLKNFFPSFELQVSFAVSNDPPWDGVFSQDRYFDTAGNAHPVTANGAPVLRKRNPYRIAPLENIFTQYLGGWPITMSQGERLP